MARVLLMVGTKKGAFLMQSDGDRRDWSLEGPFCAAWPVQDMAWDPATRSVLAAAGNAWYGPAIWRSPDLGKTWEHSSEGMAYPEAETPVVAAWSLLPAGDTIYAGVEPAGLFRSQDGGVTWSHVSALRGHPTSAYWGPGAGGLILHHIVVDPADPARAWIAISAAGCYATEDGGDSWEPRNKGVRTDFLPDVEPGTAEVGQCVHSLQRDAAGRLFQQNHCGVYRSDDGARTWQEITAGLPSQFGFPVAVHPRTPNTAWVVPLDEETRAMPGGRAAVWKTTDGGESWKQLTGGLPDTQAHLNVLRSALCTDTLEPVGLYFGTGSGSVFVSGDEGESWTEIARHLPAVTSVETVVLEA